MKNQFFPWNSPNGSIHKVNQLKSKFEHLYQHMPTRGGHRPSLRKFPCLLFTGVSYRLHYLRFVDKLQTKHYIRGRGGWCFKAPGDYKSVLEYRLFEGFTFLSGVQIEQAHVMFEHMSQLLNVLSQAEAFLRIFINLLLLFEKIFALIIITHGHNYQFLVVSYKFSCLLKLCFERFC